MMNETPLSQRRFDTNEDLLSQEERARLFADHYPLTETPPEPPTPSLPTVLTAPKGVFRGGRYYPPDVGRRAYMESVYAEQAARGFEDYMPLPEGFVSFVDRVDTLNLFHPDFVRAFELFLTRHGKGKLTITRGMTPPNGSPQDPHAIGMAADIRVENREQQARVQNAAWLVGIPTIVQAGGSQSEAHIHLDLCPHEPFLYDGDLYEGPWSL